MLTNSNVFEVGNEVRRKARNLHLNGSLQRFIFTVLKIFVM